MTRIHIAILVNCIALLLAASGTVAAQETATASAPAEMTTAVVPTTASKLLNETMYYSDVAGNRAMRIVSAEYVGGTIVLVLKSDPSRTVTVTASTDSASTGAAAGGLVRRPIPPGRMTIRIDSPEPRATLVTSYFAEDDRYTEIRFDDGGSVFITGPFTGADVRDAAVGDALGTSFGALLIIARRRFDLHRNVKRVA